jgi:hypothetical protein
MTTPVTDNDDGLDLRKFSSLKPLEQLDRLQSDFRAIDTYEKGMRTADAELKAGRTKEVKP